jgi:NADH:ubiquinone oxidoreductase subunit E
MSKQKKQVSVFSLEGRFLGFGLEDPFKIKSLRLLTAEGERQVKLAKPARTSIVLTLAPGDWLQVWGEKTVCSPTEVKLKASRIEVSSAQCLPSQPRSQAKPAAKPQQILMCQKSDCMKRGGKAVCKALEQVIHDRGLEDQVTIRGTGCMKDCKAGPNVILPNKTRYRRIQPRDVAAVIDHHFPVPPQPTVRTAAAAELVSIG